MDDDSEKRKLIGIVGPCSAGKSTLIGKLHEKGIQCRHIAQEHSYVPDMWQRIVDPLVLIYLDVSYDVSMRRKQLNMTPKEFDEQIARLDHARQHADIYLQTDLLKPGEVLEAILANLEDRGIQTEK
jgi:thymidylate kinase